MPSTSLISGTGCIGAYIADAKAPTVAIFSDVAGLGWRLSYTETHSAHHILTGLQSGTYTVTINESSFAIDATSGGVLEFDSPRRDDLDHNEQMQISIHLLF